MGNKKAHRFLIGIFAAQFILTFIFYYIIYYMDISEQAIPYLSIGLPQIVGFGIPILIYRQLNKEACKAHFLNRDLGLVNALYVVVFVILSRPMGYLLSAIGIFVFGFENTVGELISDMATQNIAITLIFSSLMPAIFEELAFRGIILDNYKKNTLLTVVVMNGFLFALMHQNLHQFLYAFALGSFFSYLVMATRSIYAGVLAHLLYNGLSVITSFYAMKTVETMGDLVDENVMDMATNVLGEELSAANIVITLGILSVISFVAVVLMYFVHEYFSRFNKVRNEMYDYYDGESRNLWPNHLPSPTEKKHFSGIFNKELVIIIVYYGISTIIPEIFARIGT